MIVTCLLWHCSSSGKEHTVSTRYTTRKAQRSANATSFSMCMCTHVHIWMYICIYSDAYCHCNSCKRRFLAYCCFVFAQILQHDCISWSASSNKTFGIIVAGLPWLLVAYRQRNQSTSLQWLASPAARCKAYNGSFLYFFLGGGRQDEEPVK